LDDGGGGGGGGDDDDDYDVDVNSVLKIIREYIKLQPQRVLVIMH
jgi:hypothetical protein